jgi:hypothetical protein
MVAARSDRVVVVSEATARLPCERHARPQSVRWRTDALHAGRSSLRSATSDVCSICGWQKGRLCQRHRCCLAGDSHYPGVSVRPPTTRLLADSSCPSAGTTTTAASRSRVFLRLRSPGAGHEPPIPTRCSRCQGSPATSDADHGHVSILRSVKFERSRARRLTPGVPVPNVSRRLLPTRRTDFSPLLTSAPARPMPMLVAGLLPPIGSASMPYPAVAIRA